MGDPTGFLKHPRQTGPERPVAVRIRDWKEFHGSLDREQAAIQGARCMDCGIPFCHEGCPLGNLIPEWNDLVYKWDLEAAADRLLATNNFPEATGRLCPAPCEAACVLGINADPVAIKEIEHYIADYIIEERLAPIVPARRTGKRVAVVGSGPAGLAAAQQLARAGHEVVVFERGERPGGLLRYGIPEFKMEKAVLDKRLAQMREEGVEFVCATAVGIGSEVPESPGHAAAPRASVVSAKELLSSFDALVLACGSTVPRDLRIPGRDLAGIHFAMEYLKAANLTLEGVFSESPISAAEKDMVIIGGGDTGADCLGTAHRQGARSVIQLEIMPRPPDKRSPEDPWPTYPNVFRVSGAHEEGGQRWYQVSTVEFLGERVVEGLVVEEVEVMRDASGLHFVPKEGTRRTIPAQLVVLAMGFVGPESPVIEELGLERTERNTVKVDERFQTSCEGVFACGDMVRGQSLVVWAIAEGRSCARGVDEYLMGESLLPAPVQPYQAPIR